MVYQLTVTIYNTIDHMGQPVFQETTQRPFYQRKHFGEWAKKTKAAIIESWIKSQVGKKDALDGWGTVDYGNKTIIKKNGSFVWSAVSFLSDTSGHRGFKLVD